MHTDSMSQEAARFGAVVLKIFELFEHAYFALFFFTVFDHVYSYWQTCKYQVCTSATAHQYVSHRPIPERALIVRAPITT